VRAPVRHHRRRRHHRYRCPSAATAARCPSVRGSVRRTVPHRTVSLSYRTKFKFCVTETRTWSRGLHHFRYRLDQRFFRPDTRKRRNRSRLSVTPIALPPAPRSRESRGPLSPSLLPSHSSLRPRWLDLHRADGRALSSSRSPARRARYHRRRVPAR